MKEKTDNINFQILKSQLENFAIKRNWQKFHKPKNLCLAMFKEVGELSEIFQWLTEKEAAAVIDNVVLKKQVEDEIADVLLYLVRLASILDINIEKSVSNKMLKNEQKYPQNIRG